MNDAGQPLVSIVMPSYNTAAFIGQAIESVQRQTWPHWELIIADDGSTDDTRIVAESYAARDPRIRFHSVPRTGKPAGTRNAGLRLTQGNFITFLDSDDEYEPDALMILLLPMLQDPYKTAVYGFNSEINEHGELLRSHMPNLIPVGEGRYKLSARAVPCWRNIILGWLPNNVGGMMMRRSTFERVGFFDESLMTAEDYQYLVRLYKDSPAGLTILPEVVMRYRIHTASITKTVHRFDELFDSERRMLDWLFEESGIPNELKRFRSQKFALAYKFLASIRLRHHQVGVARKLLTQAWHEPCIHWQDWTRFCLMPMVRTFMPRNLDARLTAIRYGTRQRQTA
jgi:glycosyltransferase involved in cell wall biosynthesis